VNRPCHSETLRNGFEFALQRRDIQRLLAVHAMKNAAHEKAFAEIVVENGEFVDIAMMPVEKADNGGNLARRARTRNGEYRLIGTGIGGHALSR
jgi:acyl CoA:acetate/3-ketoacid CoA transferase alpha subunit